MTDAADLSVSLPLATQQLATVDTFPRALADDYHLLLLADDVNADEVEALALSLDPSAAWIGAGRLQIVAGAVLLGPWWIGDEERADLGLPAWVSQVMVLSVPRQRAYLEPALAATDPLLSLFNDGGPTGLEAAALHALRPIARRLAGAIRVVDTGQIFTPDPHAYIGVSLYSPIWLTPDAVQVVLDDVTSDQRDGFEVANRQLFESQEIPRITGEMNFNIRQLEELEARLGPHAIEEARRLAAEAAALPPSVPRAEVDHYSLFLPVSQAHPGWGQIQVYVAGARDLPVALLGEQWANDGVIRYDVRWQPRKMADAFSENLPRVRRRERTAAAAMIDAIAAKLVEAAGGTVVDDSGFIVTIGQLLEVGDAGSAPSA